MRVTSVDTALTELLSASKKIKKVQTYFDTSIDRIHNSEDEKVNEKSVRGALIAASYLSGLIDAAANSLDVVLEEIFTLIENKIKDTAHESPEQRPQEEKL